MTEAIPRLTNTNILKQLYPAALPVEAEDRVLAACLAGPDVIYDLLDMHLRWRDFAGGPQKLVARAIWRCVRADRDQPGIAPGGDEGHLPVEVGTVVQMLRELGAYTGERGDGLVPPDYLDYLDRLGSDRIVQGVIGFATVVRAAGAARRAVEQQERAAELILRNPADAPTIVASLMDALSRAVNYLAEDDDASFAAIDEEEDLLPVAGIPLMIPMLDVLFGGLIEAELIGVQGQQKAGKTRFVLAMLLNIILAGVPGLWMTTDNKRVIVRNRLISLVATRWLRAPMEDEHGNRIAPHRAPKELWTIHPRRLDISANSDLEPIQKQAIVEARARLRRDARIWILDTKAGIHKADVGLRMLERYLRPPYKARWWVYDHVSDLEVGGEFGAYPKAIAAFKTLNSAHNATGIMIAQQHEAKNAGNAGGSFGTFGGGAVGRSVDSLVEILPRTKEHPDRVFWRSLASRWTEEIEWSFGTNGPSGLFTDPSKVHQELMEDVQRLPYIRAGGAVPS